MLQELLSKLAENWDDEAANSLFWDCLCHQGTCYGATYAAIPLAADRGDCWPAPTLVQSSYSDRRRG